MLGIFDWGIGGVSIHKLIKERLGDIPVIYFSDTGVTPYGKMSRSELIARLRRVIGFLRSNGVTHLVIGCNAASTAIEHLDPQGLKIIGMIEGGVAAAMKAKPTRLGLIGGRRTVLSGAYLRAFASKGIAVDQRIAQPLSALIESGDTSSAKLKKECERILAPIRNCSHILLACTHYPAIRNVIRECVSESTELIDPATEIVKRMAKWKIRPKGLNLFFTTGDSLQMQKSALAAFDIEIGKTISLDASTFLRK